MSDYAKTTNFTAKDSLSAGDPNKLIKGSEHDTEFNNIATAIATKHDSDDFADQAAAEAESSTTLIMSPRNVAIWSDANAGIVGDLQGLADPNADTLLGWDDSAGVAILFTLADEFLHAGTELSIDHDLTTNFVADEHINHLGVTILPVASSGITGGGNIAINRTIGFNLTSMAEFGIADLFEAADEFLVSDGGVVKRMDYQHFGIRIIDVTVSVTLAIGSANSLLLAADPTTDIVITIPADSVVPFKKGTFFHVMRNDVAEVDVAVTTDTFTRPNGSAVRVNGGIITILKIAQTTWVCYGDSKT